MPIHCIIIAHDEIGSALLHTTTKIFPQLPIDVSVVSITHECHLEETREATQKILSALPAEKEVLILTDLFGATPNNLARRLNHTQPFKILSGLNLPMLVKIMNYAHLPLEQLVDKAILGGKEGVFNCSTTEALVTV